MLKTLAAITLVTVLVTVNLGPAAGLITIGLLGAFFISQAATATRVT